MCNLNAKELNLKMNKLIQINTQENIILNQIEGFYNKIQNLQEFLDIINSESIISIRLIDHFVTKYSKKNKICYKISEDNDNLFYVFQSYKQQLKRYQKKNFDPFARGIRIPYFIKDSVIITTIGQLNFFSWFISKNILDYVIKNKSVIENDMNKNKSNLNLSKNMLNNENKVKKPSKIYKKCDIKISHHGIQSNIVKPIIKSTNNIIVTF